MRSRLCELGRVRRIALGALALGVCAWAEPGRAQLATDDALGLRGGSDAPSTGAPGSANLGFVQPAPDNTDLTAKTKPRGKGAPKPARPLGVYPGAQRLGLRGGTPELAVGQTPPPTIATPAPVAPRRRPAPDDKPFDPVGVEVGDLKLTPYVEESLGWASNPASTAGAQKGSAFETTEGGLSLQSEWSRSDLHGMLKAGYTDYFDAPADNAPAASGTLDGRLDVTRDLSFDAEGRFNVVAQTLASLGLATAAASQHPLVETFGATLGGAQKFGDLTLALHGTLDHTSYEDATLSNGAVDRLSTDDFSDLGLRARATYQMSPAISPFVELGFDARRYDDGVDYEGYARNSNGAVARAGAELAFTQQLTGEASLGYGARAYEDPRLPDMRSPLIDASLIWTATPLTTVTAKAQTALADSVTAGASGSVQRSYTIDVAHALTRAFTLGASAGYTDDDYVGVALRDSTTNLGVRAEYHVSRDVVLKASATRQQYESSAPNSNYIADVFLLGLRVQR